MKGRAVHFLIALGWLCFSTAWADNPSFTPEALQQLKALIEEKNSRTPAQRKMSSQLVYGLKMSRGQAIAPGVERLEVYLNTDSRGLILVDIKAEVAKQLIERRTPVGTVVVSVRVKNK